jgi:hypothetical protein
MSTDTAPQQAAQTLTTHAERAGHSELERLLDKEYRATQSFCDVEYFKHLQRVALMMSQSELVPKIFQGEKGIANCVIALDMAQRMKANPLAIMQSMYIVYGKPGWESKFVIATVNATGKFTPLRFAMTDLPGKTVTFEETVWSNEGGRNVKNKVSRSVELPKDRRCVCWATDRTGERLESPPISLEMAVQEGWFTRDGSKWKTMPDLMLCYRAATLFGRLYAPEMLMGLKTTEELEETTVLDAIQQLPTAAPGSDGPRFAPGPETAKPVATSAGEASIISAPPAGSKSTAETATTPKPSPALPSEPNRPPLTLEPEPTAVKPKGRAKQAEATAPAKDPLDGPSTTCRVPTDGNPLTPQEGLWSAMESAGVSFDNFREWLVQTDRWDAEKWGDAGAIGFWPELPAELCESVAKDVKGLNKCIVRFGKKK